MINREIIIGGEKTWQGWSSHVCWDGANVSQNSYGFLIHCDMFDCKMFILNGCEECDKLKYFISHEGSNYVIEHYAIQLCLKYLTTDEVISGINRLRDMSHQMGYKEAQSDIRKALGL